MSSITTDQGIVHYEVHGRGRPVILLHGWLGSWGLWQETMAYLGRYYRTYALDFWGFGESGKKRETYAVQDFVGLVDQFMEQLGILRAPLVGHSMGGTVSLSVALQFPHRVSKVVVVGSPIVGSSLSILLKLFGQRPIGFVVYHNLWAFKLSYRLLAPFYSRAPNWAAMMDRDISRTTLESFLLSIASLRRTDLRPFLHQLQIPAMGMFGDKDIVVHPKQWQPMQQGIPHARIERFPASGHFIMLDEPQKFMETLRSFLDSTPPAANAVPTGANTAPNSGVTPAAALPVDSTGPINPASVANGVPDATPPAADSTAAIEPTDAAASSTPPAVSTGTPEHGTASTETDGTITGTLPADNNAPIASNALDESTVPTSDNPPADEQNTNDPLLLSQ